MTLVNSNLRYSFESFMYARNLPDIIPNLDLSWLQKYTRKEVDRLLDSAYNPELRWKSLTDSVLVLHFHENPIVRHEAAFILGQINYENDSERTVTVKNLRFSMRQDRDIVPRHESIEALGEENTFCAYSIGAAADMTKINTYWLDYLDIQATVEEAFSNIVEWLKKKEGYEKVVSELLAWKNKPKIANLEELHTGKSNLELLLRMRKRR